MVPHIGVMIVSACLDDNVVSELAQKSKVLLVRFGCQKIFRFGVVLGSGIDMVSENELSPSGASLSELCSHPCKHVWDF